MMCAHQGMGKEAREYVGALKPLHSSHYVASTCWRAHVDGNVSALELSIVTDGHKCAFSRAEAKVAANAASPQSILDPQNVIQEAIDTHCNAVGMSSELSEAFVDHTCVRDVDRAPAIASGMFAEGTVL